MCVCKYGTYKVLHRLPDYCISYLPAWQVAVAAVAPLRLHLPTSVACGATLSLYMYVYVSVCERVSVLNFLCCVKIFVFVIVLLVFRVLQCGTLVKFAQFFFFFAENFSAHFIEICICICFNVCICVCMYVLEEARTYSVKFTRYLYLTASL